MIPIAFMLLSVAITWLTFVAILVGSKTDWASCGLCLLPIVIPSIVAGFLAWSGFTAHRSKVPLRFPRTYWIAVTSVSVILWIVFFGGHDVTSSSSVDSDASYTLIQRPWLVFRFYYRIFSGMYFHGEVSLILFTAIVQVVLLPVSAALALRQLFTRQS